jgi:ribosome-associated heat shock protein Hsp15
MGNSLRLDLWLFYARLYKSRTKATEACRNGRISRNGMPADASDEVSVGDSIRIREKGIYRQYEVLEIPHKNLSKDDAKRVYADITPEEVVERFRVMRLDEYDRRKSGKPGARPTKKERRIIERTKGRF